MTKTAPQILQEYIEYIVFNTSSEEEQANSVLQEDWAHQTACELRRGEFETEVETSCSQHYESHSVGMHIPDFNGFTGYIGWTYWYGGGKHGNPQEIDWIPDAYFLELIEEKTVVIKVFKKRSN
jgi:hypothetical protein